MAVSKTIDVSKLTDAQRQIRMNIRNAYMVATLQDLVDALDAHPDDFTKSCLWELMAELD